MIHYTQQYMKHCKGCENLARALKARARFSHPLVALIRWQMYSLYPTSNPSEVSICLLPHFPAKQYSMIQKNVKPYFRTGNNQDR